MAHPPPFDSSSSVRSLGIGQFINPSIHRGGLRQAQSINRFSGFPCLPTRPTVASLSCCSLLKNR
jgi:hypothetical protein